MRSTIDAPTTLLDALARVLPDSSRTTLRQMLEGGRVRVNGAVEKKARRELAPGDVIDLARKEHHALLPPDVALLYEDDAVVVVVKPVGLLTVATETERERTLQAALNRYLRAKGSSERIHVVHRLDRDTSGVLVFARSFEIREALKEQFAAHSIERIYVALVEGVPDPPIGTIRSYLREGKDLSVRSVDPAQFLDAKPAATHYRTIRSGESYSLLEVTLETGRKNQIRVHLSEKGHPVVGDPRYGTAGSPIGRLGLHAKVLGFAHPVTGKRMSFVAPVPEELASAQL